MTRHRHTADSSQVLSDSTAYAVTATCSRHNYRISHAVVECKVNISRMLLL